MRRQHKPWAVVVALGLLTAGLVAVTSAPAYSAIGDSGSSASPSASVVATDGSGRYKDRIVWVNWGDAGQTLSNNTTVTTWQQVGEATRLEVVCSLSNLSFANSNQLFQAYGGGNWSSLQHLYRSGLPGADNTLVAGIVAHRASFRIDCSTARIATYTDASFTAVQSSTPVTLGGLVVADAESTTGSEYLRAQGVPADGTTWRVIDAIAGTCNSTYRLQRDLVGSSRINMTSTGECGSWAQGNYAATAVAVTNRTTVDVELWGNGEQAVAIGYVLGVDYGDAPASYGVAGAVVSPSGQWSGNVLGSPTQHEVVSNGAVQQGLLSTIPTVAPRLGAQVFPEPAPRHSGDALGDDGWVVPPGSVRVPDEDALAGAPAPITVVPGVTTSYTVPGVSCTPNGAFVRGWIDWNRNGTFGAAEASQLATCSGGSATVSFAIPSGVRGGEDPGGDATYLRLAVAAAAAQLDQPTGFISSGEVEDWALLLRVPELQVTKTADPADSMPAAGGTVTYSVTATNVGNAPYTTSDLARLYDDVSGVVDDADLGTPTTPPGFADPSVSGDRITWQGPLAAGASVTVTYTVTVRPDHEVGDQVLRNVARVSNTVIPAGTPLVCEPDSPDDLAGTCDWVDLYRTGLDLTKQAFLATDTAFASPLPDGADLPPETEVVWRYTVTNTGSVELTNIVLTDVATEVRHDADGSTTANPSLEIECPDEPGIPPGTSVTIPALAPGDHLVCQASGQIGGT